MRAQRPQPSRPQLPAADDWSEAIRRVRAEYTEMAGMRLTQEQAGRLFGLDPLVCSMVLGWLVEENFLRLSDGLYIKNY